MASVNGNNYPVKLFFVKRAYRLLTKNFPGINVYCLTGINQVIASPPYWGERLMRILLSIMESLIFEDGQYLFQVQTIYGSTG